MSTISMSITSHRNVISNILDHHAFLNYIYSTWRVFQALQFFILYICMCVFVIVFVISKHHQCIVGVLTFQKINDLIGLRFIVEFHWLRFLLRGYGQGGKGTLRGPRIPKNYEMIFFQTFSKMLLTGGHHCPTCSFIFNRESSEWRQVNIGEGSKNLFSESVRKGGNPPAGPLMEFPPPIPFTDGFRKKVFGTFP